MQPNWPSSGSRGRAESWSSRMSPMRGRLLGGGLRAPALPAVGAGQGRWCPRRRGRSGRWCSRPSRVGGELRAVRSAGRGSTEESGGLFHPGSAGLASGRGRSASVRSASAPRDCSQCPVSVCGSGREVASRLALRSLGQPSASFDPS